MIKYDTSKDSEAKTIIKWCKDNAFVYCFEVTDKSRSVETYPFNITAPLEKKSELVQLLEEQIC